MKIMSISRTKKIIILTTIFTMLSATIPGTIQNTFSSAPNFGMSASAQSSYTITGFNCNQNSIQDNISNIKSTNITSVSASGDTITIGVASGILDPDATYSFFCDPGAGSRPALGMYISNTSTICPTDGAGIDAATNCITTVQGDNLVITVTRNVDVSSCTRMVIWKFYKNNTVCADTNATMKSSNNYSEAGSSKSFTVTSNSGYNLKKNLTTDSFKVTIGNEVLVPYSEFLFTQSGDSGSIFVNGSSVTGVTELSLADEVTKITRSKTKHSLTGISSITGATSKFTIDDIEETAIPIDETDVLKYVITPDSEHELADNITADMFTVTGADKGTYSNGTLILTNVTGPVVVSLTDSSTVLVNSKPAFDQFDLFHANGKPLIITDGTVDGTTSIYVDRNDNGQLDASDTITTYENRASGTKVIVGDNGKITMLGGCVTALSGMDGTNITATNCKITILGGTVQYSIGNFDSDLSMTIKGGNIVQPQDQTIRPTNGSQNVYRTSINVSASDDTKISGLTFNQANANYGLNSVYPHNQYLYFWLPVGTATVSYNGKTYSTVVEANDFNYLNEDYTITFNADGGTITPATTKTFNGSLASIPTPTKQGYIFKGWYRADDADQNIVDTTDYFRDNCTLKAKWVVDNNASQTPSTPVYVPNDSYVPVSNETTKNEVVKITSSAVTKAINNVKVKNGKTTIGLNVKSKSDNGTVTVNLPLVLQRKVVKNEIDTTIITVTNQDISVNISLDTIEELYKKYGTDIEVTIQKSKASSVIVNTNKKSNDKPVYNVTLKTDRGQSITKLSNGYFEISLPYTLDKNEKSSDIQGVRLTTSGKSIKYKTRYDSKTNSLIITTNKSGTYAVVSK